MKYVKVVFNYLLPLLGAVGVVYSIVTSYMDKERKNIAIKRDDSVTLIYSGVGDSSFCDIYDKNFIEMYNIGDRNIYKARYYLWNNGNKSIKKEDILDSLVVTTVGDDSIISVKLVNTTRRSVGITSVQRCEGGLSVVDHIRIDLLVLDPGDGISFDVCYIGDKDQYLEVEGDVVETHFNNDKKWPKYVRYLRYRINDWFIQVTLIVVMMVVMYGMFIGDNKKIDLIVDGFREIVNSSKNMKIFVNVVYYILVVMLVLYLIMPVVYFIIDSIMIVPPDYLCGGK